MQANLAQWDLIDEFTAVQAGFLWFGDEPETNELKQAPQVVQQMAMRLLRAIPGVLGARPTAELWFPSEPDPPPKRYTFTRNELVFAARLFGHFPLFLFPELRQSNGPPSAPTDKSLLATIATMLAAWPGGTKAHPSGKDLEKAAQSVGVSISDDTIRKALQAAREIAPVLKPPA